MPDEAKERPSRRGFLGGVAAAGMSGCAAQDDLVSRDDPAWPGPFRERLLACLGGPWPDPCDLEPRVDGSDRKDGYRIESVTYQAEPGDRIPAKLLVPDGVDAANPAPAVAVWHQHNGEWHLGKSEPAGLAGNPMHHTGARLAREGYVVLCPDALCFEDRQDPTGRVKNNMYERYQFLRYVLEGRCLAWKNILDMRRAVDFLESRPEVRNDRIGCYGHSMGSTHTWLVGPWEPRLKCLVGNCCLPTYEAILRDRIMHCFPNFIPGLAAFGDTPDLAALIAPRALHLNFGAKDTWSPVADVRRAMTRIARAYALAGTPDRFTWLIEEEVGHVLSEPMWERVRDTFRKHL